MKLRASRVSALWTLVFSLAIGTAAFVFAVLNEAGQRFEATVLEAADFRAAPPGPLMFVSNTTVIVALIVVTIVALIRWGIARAVRVFIAPALALLLSQLLKLTVLERPPLWEVDAANTFPSGHMTVFAVLAGAAIWAVPPSWRGFMSVLSWLVLSLVGIQILAYGWHRPSDVIGAVALSLASFALIAWAAPLSESRVGNHVTPRLSRSLLSVFLTLSLIVAVGALIVGMILSNGRILLFAGQAGAVAVCAFFSRAAIGLTRVR
jgi:hypothetical protein